MRRIAILFATLALLSVGCAAAPASTGPLAGLDIRVMGGGWGGAPAAAIEQTLYAVAGALLQRLPVKLNAPIVVTHTDGPPIALYERGPAGEYLVHLHATGPRWHLYVYEFAHELTHIVSNYDSHAAAGKRRRNQWFEESLCETASLFALERLSSMGEALHASEAPGQEAGMLHRFFDTLINEPHRHLPPDTSMDAWLLENEPGLRSNPYLRDRDDLVARRLLPLFQEQPGGWAALAYLNLDADDDDATFPQYLDHWQENAPESLRGFVAKISEAMGMRKASVANLLASGAKDLSVVPVGSVD